MRHNLYTAFFTKIVVFFSCLLLSTLMSGQTGNIRGHVYDAETGDPIIYANLLVEGTDVGGNSDDNGFFTLSDIPIGEKTLLVSYIGYEEIVIPVSIDEISVNYYKVELQSGGVQLGVVDISAERQQARTEVRISKLQVTKKQIKALPSTGGDADILQYLQVLPGIVSTGDQGGQLYIRGGSPVQNKILLDGLTIYNPFHSIGFYSTFETEIIRNVDVLTGGFNAEHGGRISAIVDINTREGNKKRLAGQLSGSPFMVKGLIEGPILKSEEGGTLSFIATAKSSIIQETSTSIYRHAIVNDTIGLPFSFTDAYGKLSYVTGNGSQFNFFGFNFDDSFDNPLVSTIDWNNNGGGLYFNLLPNASSLTLNGIVGLSNYSTSIRASDNPRESAIRELNIGLDFNYLTNESSVKYGVDIKSIRTEFDFVNPFNIPLQQKQTTTEISGFLKVRRAWDKLVIEPGIRLPYYASLGEFSFEPRLGLKYNLLDATRIKLGAGLYSQNIISTSNERDVVNLFNGFISGPDESFQDFNGENVTTRLQKSRHLTLGVEQDIGRFLQLNVEGYFKDFTQLVVINRNKTLSSQSDFSTEIGEAFGIDFSAKYDIPKWYFWATYSLGFVNRFDGEQDFPTLFDRRHNVNFLATYTTGADNDILISLRWNYGSGFPFTKTQAFFNNNTFTDGSGTTYETDNPDNVGIIFSSERNGGRLPDYHRLDISVQKTFRFTERLNLELIGSVTNVYDRPNIFFFDRIEFDRVDQLPIMPSLAARFNF